MDSLLILILVFVGSCALVFTLMAGISWLLNWIMNKYHVGRPNGTRRPSTTTSNPTSTNSPHVTIPILEARAQRPKDSSEIESTCLVILPHESRHSTANNGVITDYAIGMKNGGGFEKR